MAPPTASVCGLEPGDAQRAQRRDDQEHEPDQEADGAGGRRVHAAGTARAPRSGRGRARAPSRGRPARRRRDPHRRVEPEQLLAREVGDERHREQRDDARAARARARRARCAVWQGQTAALARAAVRSCLSSGESGASRRARACVPAFRAPSHRRRRSSRCGVSERALLGAAGRAGLPPRAASDAPPALRRCGAGSGPRTRARAHGAPAARSIVRRSSAGRYAPLAYRRS